MLKNIPLMIVLAASLTACGGSDGDKKPTPTSVVPSSTPASVAASSTPASVAASSTPASVAASSAPASSTPAASSVGSSVMSSVSSSESSSSSSASDALAIDFELDTVGSTYGSIGWDNPAANATVVAITSVTGLAANADSINALRVVPLNWNSVPVFEVTLPQGKTLADYKVQLDVYFPTTTENSYKTFMLFAGTTITGAAEDVNVAFQSKRNNANDNTPAWDEVDKWVTLTLDVDPTKAALLNGTIQLALGINRPAGTDTDSYYYDNITLVELP